MNTESLDQQLIDYLQKRLEPLSGLWVVGFSGGLDSSVLLHALVRAGYAHRLTAVHVHHNLSPQADQWAQHCQQVAAALGVRFERCHIDPGAGPNLEERARDMRREKLLEQTPQGAVLMLAHQADDQAETLLLRLFRGAGPRGLASIRERRNWKDRVLLRPLLHWQRAELETIAHQWKLNWIEDPANADLHHDRNILRHQILPMLQQHWPAISEILHRDALLQAETADLLDEVSQSDFNHQVNQQGSLSIEGLQQLTPARRNNLLYGWLQQRGIRPPAGKVMQRVANELFRAAEDRQPVVQWSDAGFYRFRNQLFLLTPDQAQPLERFFLELIANGERKNEWRLADWQLRIEQQPPKESADMLLIPVPENIQEIEVSAAAPGERMLLHGQHVMLRERWRQQAVPPWERMRMPVFRYQNKVVAAAGIGVSDHWRKKEPGCYLVIRQDRSD